MDIEKYTVIITPTAYREINRIYEYLEFELYAENATKELMKILKKRYNNWKKCQKYIPKLKFQMNYKESIEE